MYITELIAQHLIEVHEGDNWTEVDLKTVLSDVTSKEAATQTPASTNTIASLLHHLTYWNRVMVQRINDIVVPDTPDNGFDMPPLTNQMQWQELKADNLRSATELATAIRAFDESKLFDPIAGSPFTAYKNLQGSVEHVHYHLGQILILKNFIRRRD